MLGLPQVWSLTQKCFEKPRRYVSNCGRPILDAKKHQSKLPNACPELPLNMHSTCHTIKTAFTVPRKQKNSKI
eukprot:136540-Amphidinium_carterae.1